MAEHIIPTRNFDFELVNTMIVASPGDLIIVKNKVHKEVAERTAKKMKKNVTVEVGSAGK